MMIKIFFRLTLLGLPVLILMSVSISSASSLTVLSTGQNITVTNDSVTAEKVKPPECAGVTLVDIRTGDGDGNNNLILGSAGNDTINGQGGSDCILGVDGNDTIYGDGNNLLFATGSDDIILGGNGNDTMYGDGRNLIFAGSGNIQYNHN